MVEMKQPIVGVIAMVSISLVLASEILRAVLSGDITTVIPELMVVLIWSLYIGFVAYSSGDENE